MTRSNDELITITATRAQWEHILVIHEYGIDTWYTSDADIRQAAHATQPIREALGHKDDDADWRLKQ